MYYTATILMSTTKCALFFRVEYTLYNEDDILKGGIIMGIIGLVLTVFIVGKVIYNCEKEDKLNVTKDHNRYKGLF